MLASRTWRHVQIDIIADVTVTLELAFLFLLAVMTKVVCRSPRQGSKSKAKARPHLHLLSSGVGVSGVTLHPNF